MVNRTSSLQPNTPKPHSVKVVSIEEVTRILKDGSSSPQDDIDRLQKSVSLLEEQIKALVLDNRQLLLSETSRLRDASKDFQKLFLSVRSLQSVAAQVKAEVAQPRELLSSKTAELANIYSTVDLLRQTAHHNKIVQRIKSDIERITCDDSADKGRLDHLDLSKLARLLTEAQQAWDEADLSGIRLSDENQGLVEKHKVYVQRQVLDMLEQGVESRNQADIGGALQSLFTLGELEPALEKLVQGMVHRVKKRFSRALEMKNLSAMSVGSTAFEGRLWEELGNSMEELRDSAVCAWYLEKVLARKKDPVSYSKFIDLVRIKPFSAFWTMSIQRIKGCFEAAMVQRSRVVKDALVGNYVKLAGFLEGTLSSIIKETMSGRCKSISEEEANAYYNAVASVESEYLLSLKSRFEGLAMTAFPGGSKPLASQVDLQTLYSRFHEEMKKAQRGGERSVAITAAILGTVLMTIASQARDMAVLVDLSASSRERNVSLAKSLDDLMKNIAIIRRRLFPGSKGIRALEAPTEVLQQTVRELLEPIFKSETIKMKNIIKKMHAVNFAAAEGAESEVAVASSYVVELKQALGDFSCNVVGKCAYNTSKSAYQPISIELVTEMCSKLIDCWIHHASLVRPLTSPGKLQLAKDAIEVESGLQQLQSVSNQDISELQSFRKLLFLESPYEVEELKTLNLPKAVVLHHLFSRLPEKLVSPYSKNKLSPAQYYVWIEDHSVEDVVNMIKTAICNRGDDPVVAVMIALAED
jgi:hypothetical protein